MDQTIIFDKTCQERLEKYEEILSEDISAKQVMLEWSSYLETTVDQSGWQAVWKIPRSICENFNISFPTLALVFVESINFEDLTVNVKILSVQNEVKLPECLTVCLYHLWPTEEQDETIVLNLNGTSEALDNLRFFHKYLWRAWDEENSVENWFTKSLIPRLKLYYDLKQGVVSKNWRDYYRLQLIEAKEKYDKFIKLQLELEDDLDCFDHQLSEKLRDLHKLRKILDLFENPLLRKKIFNENHNTSEKSNLWLVMHSDLEFDDYFEFIENVKAFSNSESEFKTAKSLQEALDLAKTNDTIFIGSGKHVVQSSGNIMEGGKLVNVNFPKEAIISTTNEHLLFSFKNGTIILQNLILQLNTTQNGIRVRSGANLKLENCTIQGHKVFSDLKSVISTQQGIISDSGSILNLNNCNLSYLGTALSVNSGTATLNHSEIKNVHCAIRGQNFAAFTLNDCKISRCLKCALQVEDTSDNLICGGVEILKSCSLSNIKIFNTNIEDMSGPEVIITNKLKFRPVRDILSNPAFNTTLNMSVY